MWSVGGNNLPSKPVPGQYHIFLERVTTGLTFTDQDGSTIHQAAQSLDLLRWMGDTWHRLGNLASGNTVDLSDYVTNEALTAELITALENYRTLSITLAAIQGGANVTVDRTIDGQITLNGASAGQTPDLSNYVTNTGLATALIAALEDYRTLSLTLEAIQGGANVTIDRTTPGVIILNGASAGQTPDLSNYVTRTELNGLGYQDSAAVLALTGSAGHITQAAAQTLIDNQMYLNQTEVESLIGNSGHLNSVDVQNYLNAQGYRREAQINSLISTALVNGEYATSTAVQALVNAAIVMVRGGVPDNMNTLAALATAIALRAPINNPTFTGDVIVPDSLEDDDSGRAANTRFVLAELVGVQPVATAHIAAGWSDNDVGQTSELTAISQTNSVTIPTRATNGYLVIWHSLTSGTLTEVHIGTSSFNELSTFGDPIQISGPENVSGNIRVSRAQRNAALLSGETLRMVFS